jgi:hypothetical protein
VLQSPNVSHLFFPSVNQVAYGWALTAALLSRLVPLWHGAKSLQWSYGQIVRSGHSPHLHPPASFHVCDIFCSAIDCNIDLLDTLTLSVLVAKTARDLKKSPRKLLLAPSSALLILLLRVVLPMMTSTFLTDFWLEPMLLPFDVAPHAFILQVWRRRNQTSLFIVDIVFGQQHLFRHRKRRQMRLGGPIQCHAAHTL